MLEKKQSITALWLYKKENENGRLVDKKTGEPTANTLKILLKDIIFATTLNIRKDYLKVVDKNGTEYFKKLPLMKIVEIDRQFVFTRKDTIINTLHVDKKFEWDYIWIQKHRFKISRWYKQEVRESFSSVVV